MSPAERALEMAQDSYEKALRDVLREQGNTHCECTFRVVTIGSGERIVQCKHGQVLGPADRSEVWG